MHLEPGETLGRYEILSFIGAGGMGQVYRARDEQLGRDVAVKILPSAFVGKAQVVARFQQEAKALGLLNHPNLVTVFDFGTHGDSFYIVLELLEGETLRARLREGPLSQRKSIQYALQIARGMDAAHERSIIHRDLKPENIFLTKDGRLKILDFGLAKMNPELAAIGAGDDSPTLVGETHPGIVMGTVGYIAPEQLRAEPIDGRTDIFAFGAILYEMLTGRQAFQGGTPVEILSAILKDDPVDLHASGVNVSPGVELVIQRCLEKRKEERFQTAHDLAFSLEALGSATDTLSMPFSVWRSRVRRHRYKFLAAAALLAIIVASILVWERVAPNPLPTYRQLTFRRGDITGARFASDGSILYSASWEGSGYEIYSGRNDSIESRPLGIRSRELLAVSSTGNLALLVNSSETSGTLAVVSLAGGAPREIADDVVAADWSPDGKQLAIVRRLEGSGFQIEYPIRTIVYQSPTRVRDLRVSPDGKRIAFRLREARLGKSFALFVLDVAVRKPRKLGEWTNAKGLAWAANGRRIVFGTSGGNGSTELHAVDLGGSERLIGRLDGVVKLHDVSRDGELLLTRDDYREGVMARAAGAERERDLSWFDGSGTSDISPDGRLLLFSEFGEAGGERYSVFTRPTTGEPAVRLGDGYGVSLSPDGKSALVIVPGRRTLPARLAIVPLGAGETRYLPRGVIEDYEFGAWLPDGHTIVFNGRAANGRMRLYRQDVFRGDPSTIGDPGFRIAQASRPASPDGSMIVVSGDEDGLIHLVPLDGTAPRKAPIERGYKPVAWSADGKELFVYREEELPARMFRANIATGQLTLVRELMPGDPSGVYRIMDVVVTPDGSAYAYGVMRNLSNLFVSRGWRF
ncbi:MAG TPA: protein kinase [Thermoanaerobaculia bacterium]|nr:protein kinase [Thermoanaerobaculia bacterium]